MGKKIKKKGRSGPKDKRVITPSPKIVPEKSISKSEVVSTGVTSVKEKKACGHLGEGLDLAKLSLKFATSPPIRCEDCREGVVERRESKGKGKQGKKKGGGSAVSTSETKAIWVCVECGHFSCGGAGFPTTPQSHAVRHAKQTHHPLAFKFEKPNLRWCFPCDTLIPVQKGEENGERKDPLSELVKTIKAKPSSGPSLDVEDVWFTSGSVTSEINLNYTVSSNAVSGGVYVVRGLVNLGNTCFFNSVVQNLLAMDRLRDYFLTLEGSVGPLTASLKKLFVETNPTAGLRNVINPRSVLGCVSAKYPQFKGFQQHDSHELLRCLLDGLCTEDSHARKQALSSEDNGDPPKPALTFVDAIFGGQISSTVTCMECGHASVTYEPFLDLSLPLPTKSAPSKKAPAVPRAKKSKLPPKRTGRFRQKNSRDPDSLPAHSVSYFSTDEKYVEGASETLVTSSGDTLQIQPVIPETTGDRNGSASHKLLVTQGLENKQAEESCMEENASSSNHVEQVTGSNDDDTTSQIKDFTVSQDNGKEMVQIPSSSIKEESPIQDDLTWWLDYCEPVSLSDHIRMASQIDEGSSVQDSGNCEDSNLNLDNFGNSWEEESPLQVHESQVLLLPYNEIAPTTDFSNVDLTTVSCEQDSTDFDGFGGLFDEPEAVIGPSLKPGTTSEAMVRSYSESDPDEIDNTGSPVSVDRCLTYFTSPELLCSAEHAWHCEQCSKVMLEQRRKKKNFNRPTSNYLRNRFEDGIPNGSMGRQTFCSTDGSLVLQNGGNNCQNSVHSQRAEANEVASELEEGSNEVNSELQELSNSPSSFKTCQESFTCKASDYCTVDEPHESEGSEDEVTNTQSAKVTRDATKRFLISRAPPILTIHLKRFKQDARGRLNKLDGYVDFRESIVLKPYMDPSCSDKAEQNYRLVGVVEHLGSMRGGHYVAYVRGHAAKSSGKAEKESVKDFVWHYASDSIVREVSLQEVLGCEAYILFYEKV